MINRIIRRLSGLTKARPATRRPFYATIQEHFSRCCTGQTATVHAAHPITHKCKQLRIIDRYVTNILLLFTPPNSGITGNFSSLHAPEIIKHQATHLKSLPIPRAVCV